MAQVINTNVASLFAGAALNKSAQGLQVAMARLSSGLRINSVADDPTGLGIATGLDAKVRGANMAARKAADAVTAAQTYDGYLAQITENAQRLREIAVQLGGTASGSEATALSAENLRIAGLMNTAVSNVVVNSSGATQASTGVSIAGSAASLKVSDLDAFLTTTVTDARAKYGADIATFSSVVANLQLESVNLSAQYSRVMDTDYAIETQSMTRNQILQQAGTAMLAQANQVPNTVMTLLR